MIDLTEYGFIESTKTERRIDYIGNDFTVSIYNYFQKTFDGKEISNNTFVVSSQQFTSRVRPISELAQWLNEKQIEKII